MNPSLTKVIILIFSDEAMNWYGPYYFQHQFNRIGGWIVIPSGNWQQIFNAEDHTLEFKVNTNKGCSCATLS
jgi:hypothetical protein